MNQKSINYIKGLIGSYFMTFLAVSFMGYFLGFICMGVTLLIVIFILTWRDNN